MRLVLAMRAIVACWEAGRFPLLVGEPGIGKSAGVFQAAKAVRRKVHEVKNLVQEDPADLKGYGFPDWGEKVTKILPREWALNLNRLEPGIVFYDELGQALQSTMCAARPTLLPDPMGRRQIGDLYIDVPHFFVGATNRREDRSCVNQLPDHFASVVTELPVEFHFGSLKAGDEGWERWAVDNDIHPYVLAHGRLKPNAIHHFVAGKRSPLARSWEFVSQFEKLEGVDDETKKHLINGTIGQEAGGEYWVLRENAAKLPNIHDILTGKVRKIPEGKPTQYLIITVLAGHVNEKNIKHAINYIEDMPGELREIFVDDLLTRDKNLIATRAMVEYVEKHGSVNI